MEDKNSSKSKVLNQIDLLTTICFCIEAVLKIIAQGFIFNGEKSYLLNTWNILDFSIVLFSVESLLFESNLSFIKVFRTARILRPLKLI